MTVGSRRVRPERHSPSVGVGSQEQATLRLVDRSPSGEAELPPVVLLASPSVQVPGAQAALVMSLPVPAYSSLAPSQATTSSVAIPLTGGSFRSNREAIMAVYRQVLRRRGFDATLIDEAPLEGLRILMYKRPEKDWVPFPSSCRPISGVSCLSTMKSLFVSCFKEDSLLAFLF